VKNLMSGSEPITDAELELYQEWIGRQMAIVDDVSKDVINRFAAAIDRDMPADGLVPPMWHYGLFLDAVPTSNLGSDGHPPRGGAMPPVRLPRRMFAGSEIEFVSPLQIGLSARCISEVVSVDRRKGSTADLVLVRVEDRISQNETLCIKEVRTIVYLGHGASVEPIIPNPQLPSSSGDDIWTPDSVALFRFSAVTFNAHRIHYDLPYAQEAEGYPNLVVHGPFTALRLCDFASRHRAKTPTRFTFRGEAPLFSGQAVTLSPDRDDEALTVTARRCDGKIAMRAAVQF
jgi:3-methylfumaryl-CoA hydratase